MTFQRTLDEVIDGDAEQRAGVGGQTVNRTKNKLQNRHGTSERVRQYGIFSLDLMTVPFNSGLTMMRSSFSDNIDSKSVSL